MHNGAKKSVMAAEKLLSACETAQGPVSLCHEPIRKVPETLDDHEVQSKLPSAEAEKIPFVIQASRQYTSKKVDYVLLRLFCCLCLAPFAIEHDTWKDLFRLLLSWYRPPTRDKLENILILQAAAIIRVEWVEILKNEINLTITWDNGSTRAGDKFTTIHITTSDGRAFLMQTHESTTTSHNMEFIGNSVLEVRTVNYFYFQSAAS